MVNISGLVGSTVSITVTELGSYEVKEIMDKLQTNGHGYVLIIYECNNLYFIEFLQNFDFHIICKTLSS